MAAFANSDVFTVYTHEMPGCAVKSCKSRSATHNLQTNGITFHLFPKNVHYRKRWVDASGQPATWQPTKTSTICSRHFLEQFFDISKNNRRMLYDFAVPTLLLKEKSYSTVKFPGLPTIAPAPARIQPATYYTPVVFTPVTTANLAVASVAHAVPAVAHAVPAVAHAVPAVAHAVPTVAHAAPTVTHADTPAAPAAPDARPTAVDATTSSRNLIQCICPNAVIVGTRMRKLEYVVNRQKKKIKHLQYKCRKESRKVESLNERIKMLQKHLDLTDAEFITLTTTTDHKSRKAVKKKPVRKVSTESDSSDDEDLSKSEDIADLIVKEEITSVEDPLDYDLENELKSEEESKD